MRGQREILADRIDELVARSGRSARDVSLAATGKPDLIRDLKRRKSIPKAAALAAVADQLGTTTEYLLGRTDSPGPVQSEVDILPAPLHLRERREGFRNSQLDRIPVLGSGYCDDLLIEDGEAGQMEVERFMLDVDHVVQMVSRPPALAGSPDAYGIYFHGASMEPRFFQGELGIVDPRRPPSPGDFVVVQLNDGASDEVQTVLVKQLVRVSSAFVELHQYNPDLTFRIARQRVSRLHRICTSRELLG